MDLRADTESVRTRDRVLDLLLKSEEPRSVQDFAAALGISRNAAHQQITALERQGLIQRASAIRTRGRPSQGFELSPAGSATFTRQYALLAKHLVAEMARFLDPDELTKAMERIGVTLAHNLAARVGNEPEDVIPNIAAVMRELGYESTAIAGANGPEIEAHNCVFHDLAVEDARICEVDLALLRTLSGKTVEHRRCMARGERSCRFAFTSAEPAA